MKKIICILLSVFMLFSVGCSKQDVKDSEADTLKKQLLELSQKVDTLETKVNDSNKQIETLQTMLPKQSTGVYSVKATKLNMRKGPSTDDIVLGTLDYGTKINITDTSDPLWYKVSLDLSKYKNEKSEYTTLYSLNKNSLEVKNQYINDVNSFYVCSLYLSNTDVKSIEEVPVGEKPFVYGLLFYDDQTAGLLANEIWDNMKDDLKKLGYTGVKVMPVNRDTYEDDIKNNVYDAVESAPGQFAKVNEDTKYMEAFAKDVIGGETSYTGVIIVNKNSNITDYSDLKGKTVLCGKEYSESSYLYQKYYLNEIKGIDIEKDLKLEKDNYHQVIFYKVATGEAEAGFCGDFVMTNSYGDMKESLEMSDIDLKSKEELDELRNNVICLPMNEISEIPNNPHSLKLELYNNKDFTQKLYDCVKSIYSENKEDYDITTAESKEYESLNDFE